MRQRIVRHRGNDIPVITEDFPARREGELPEITPEMIEAGADVLNDLVIGFASREESAKRCYAAMFSVALRPMNPSDSARAD